MVITVTAPRKGQGQTITSVNLAAVISALTKSRCLIVDINNVCRDIEYYLSCSAITKGIDDFYALCSSNLLNEAELYQYTKHISSNLDIMAGGSCFCLEYKHLNRLFKTASSQYSYVVIDAGGVKDDATKYCMDNSDAVVTILAQSANVIHTFCSTPDLYMENLHKTYFIVNRYINGIKGQRPGYTLKDITRELSGVVPGPSVYALDFDIALMNECNMGSALNYIVSAQKTKNRYARQLEEFARCLLASESGKEAALRSKKSTLGKRSWLMQNVRYLLERN